MSVTRRESILRQNPYRDRRSFVARAMGLSPIGDIGTATLSGQVSLTAKTWETATDWDNAVDEAGVVHETNSGTDWAGDDVIELGYPSFDQGGSSLVAYWPGHDDSGPIVDVANGHNATVSGATAGSTTGSLLGRTAWDFDGNDYADAGDVANLGGNSELTVFGWVDFDGPGSKRDYLIAKNTNVGGSDTWEWLINIENDGKLRVGIRSGSTNYLAYGSNDLGGGLHFIGFVFDGPNGVLKGYEDGSHVATNNSVPSSIDDYGDPVIWGRDNDGSDYLDGRASEVRAYNRALSDTEMSNAYNDITSGSLTTATKSFASSNKPDLQNLSYSLNGGSIDVDVIGSPGTASEEVVTQTLDGATSYSLTWSNSHTDFRVRPKPSVPSVTNDTPSVSRIEIL